MRKNLLSVMFFSVNIAFSLVRVGCAQTTVSDLEQRDQYWRDVLASREKAIEKILLSYDEKDRAAKQEEYPRTADECLKRLDNPETSWRTFPERMSIDEYRKLGRVYLDRYPLVHIAPRLAYEYDRDVQSYSNKHKYSLTEMTRELHDQFNALNDPRQRGVPTATVVRPARHDDKIFRSRVAIALKMLHEQKTEAFAQQTSFGFRRVPLIGYSDLYPAERPIVSLPEQPLLVSPENQYYEKPKNVLAWEADVREHYPKYLHLSMYFQFGRDEWYSPQRGYARGFSPHAAVSTVRWDYDVYRAPVQPEWQVMQLELVSLLKFDDYRVYISDKLPNMSELVDADTRPLDSFETVSLGALFEGEFIVAQESPNEMRLLGAVRAAEKCIDCHSVKPGELLGAFSYRLQRVVSEPSNGEVIGGK